MSIMVSGTNIQNITEYWTGNAYTQYDVVEFALHSGKSLYPSGISAAKFWFTNKNIYDFYLTPDSNILRWKNSIYSEFTYLAANSASTAPPVNFDNPYVTIGAPDYLSATLNELATGTRTVFFVFESPEEIGGLKQEIFSFGSVGSTTKGAISVARREADGAECFYHLHSNTFMTAPCPIYGHVNILTLTMSADTSTVVLRQNGQYVGTLNGVSLSLTNSFFVKSFSIGRGNSYGVDINYYDILLCDEILTTQQIEGIERYFFEQYFDEDQTFFVAKSSFAASELKSPITISGQSFWTKDINDLFTPSYGSSASFVSKINKTNLHDGYTTNVVGISNPLVANFTIHYEGLTDRQAKAMIALFQISPETENKSISESFKEKVVDLFQPYKTGTHVYFTDIAHKSIYEDINNITINARSIYGSIYNYKGINLDFTNCKIFNDVAASPWNYSKDDIFYYKSSVYSQRGYYYYTGANLTNAILDATYQPLGNTSWFTKEFYFKTDLEYDINSAIRLINTEFNNSTSAIIKDGINYNTLEIPLKFSKRTNKEARSILKFLDSHGGYKIFDYTLPQPYNKTIKVYCPEWNHTYNFFDNHDIDVKLIESKYATISNDIVYNTLLSPYTFGKEYCPFAPFVPPDTVPEDDPEIPPPDIPPGGGINFFKMKIYLWSEIANVGGIANVQQIAIANIKEGVNKETFFGTVNGLGVIGAVPSGPCPISDPSSPAYTPNDACDTGQGFITVYFNEKYLIYGTTDTNAIQIAWLYTGSGPTDPLLITTVITHSEIIARYTSLQTAYLDDPTLKDDVLAMGYETYCQFKRLTAA